MFVTILEWHPFSTSYWSDPQFTWVELFSGDSKWGCDAILAAILFFLFGKLSKGLFTLEINWILVVLSTNKHAKRSEKKKGWHGAWSSTT